MNNKQETIFIDTSIFIEQNFIYGYKIKTIFEQAEKGEIKIILPKLIYDEILNRISIKIEEEVKTTQKLSLLKNIYENKIGEASLIVKKFQSVFKETIKRAKVEIIEYPKDVAIIEEIFTNYFQIRPPFGTKSKKCEFPDAFTLKILENWAIEKEKTIKVFSNDNDIKSIESEHLKVEDFGKFVNELNENK
ncbi:hypothetical protein CAPN006_16690 [Capnocytophaga canimorsus]|uniref:PIN domain-containing protein n=1 Tax=Capnocytophaga canimorsus TaxID=28188 RepID=UPI001AC88FF6|nr:PIN domain-containing protein [Capnocytophaga canimorsus]GIM57276.1 hypothetical protein CAPN006_16690 [Capnocytophaga canimorsus]